MQMIWEEWEALIKMSFRRIEMLRVGGGELTIVVF